MKIFPLRRLTSFVYLMFVALILASVFRAF
jgi:hypothetical protein